MEYFDEKIQGKLGDIAKTVGKLEDTVDKHQQADSRAARFFEQKKALHEIQSILRDSDQIEEYHQERGAAALEEAGLEPGSGFTTLSPTESNEDVVLDRINTQLMHMGDALEGTGDEADKLRSYMSQKRALHEIKKILHDAGQYDGYTENELQYFDGLYT